MDNKEMNNYKNKVVEYVDKNRKIFNTILDLKTMQEISILSEGCFVERHKSMNLTGFSFKDMENVDGANEYCKNGLKLYDIIIFYKNIELSIKYIKEKLNKEIKKDVAIKSLITHELMHSLSRGFAFEKENMLKDEAYTDYYAKIVFDNICSDQVYFTPYEYLNDDTYNNFRKEAEDKSKSDPNYFQIKNEK